MTGSSPRDAFDERAVVRQSERTASRVIDGKAVVVLIDSQELHTLNPVGTLIWELADEGRTFGAIVDEIAAEFEVDREQALADAQRFLEELRIAGAVKIEQADR